MRELKIGTQRHTKVFAVDEPGPGGACHEYLIYLPPTGVPSGNQHILFQKGPVKETGVNGIHNEDLIVIVIDRLMGFQSGEYACDENRAVLDYLRMVLEGLNRRTKRRIAAYIEDTIMAATAHKLDTENLENLDYRPEPGDPSAKTEPKLEGPIQAKFQYRHKPTLVEAHQWFPDIEIDGVKVVGKGTGAVRGTFITIHGQETFIELGDYVIREPDGIHWYPSKPDIFRDIYEAVLDGRNE